MKLGGYGEYRDSGRAWLEMMPSHWNILRGKGVFSAIDIRSKTGKEELLTVSSSDGVIPRSQKSVTMFMAKSYVGHKLCWPGDLVVNSLWAWMQGLGVARHHGLISSAYSVYRPRSEFKEYARFFHYLLRSAAYKWELQSRSKGVWLSRLQLSDLAFMDMPILLPPPDEQTAIVRFLDNANRRLDKAIRAKRKLIALLNEQKQAIIHRAVTRGLDPDVPLKDSGIFSIGKIPKHWTISRLKFEASHIVDCLHSTPNYSVDGEFPAIRTADVQPGKLRLAQARKVSKKQFDLWTSRLAPQEDDILYSREGERYGMAALVPCRTQLCISQRMMVFRIKPTQCSDYIMWQLNCPHVYAQASTDIIGSTSPHVNVEKIKNFELIIPPLSEQRRISAWIHAQLEDIDGVATRNEREISLLREYKTRLIADVVTGKLDVREAARHLPEDSDELEEVEAVDEAELDLDADLSAEPSIGEA